MPDIIIHQIQSEENLDKCAEILVAAYNAEPWNDNWTKAKALEKLQCFYHSPQFMGWTAFIGDEMAGCCVGNIEPYYTGDYFYLKEMFVLPQYQHQGIGKQLLARLQSKLDSIAIHSIILFTGKDFFPYDFYLKSGFAEMEEMRMMHCTK